MAIFFALSPYRPIAISPFSRLAALPSHHYYLPPKVADFAAVAAGIIVKYVYQLHVGVIRWFGWLWELAHDKQTKQLSA